MSYACPEDRATLGSDPSAERGFRRCRIDVINTHDPEMKALKKLEGFIQVTGIYVGSQAVTGVVGHGKQVVFVIVNHDRSNRAEGFFPVNDHIRIHMAENCWGIKEPPVQTVFSQSPAMSSAPLEIASRT